MAKRLQEEFGRFWEQTRDRVRAYMFCACSNATDADDLAQECYLRVLRKWGHYRQSRKEQRYE